MHECTRRLQKLFESPSLIQPPLRAILVVQMGDTNKMQLTLNVQPPSTTYDRRRTVVQGSAASPVLREILKPRPLRLGSLHLLNNLDT